MFKVPCLTSRLYARHTSWRTGFGCSCWWDLWRKWTWLLSARPRSLQLDGLRWSWVCDWLLEVNAVAAAAAAAAGVSDIRRRLQLAARGRSVAVVVRPARRRSIQRAVAGVELSSINRSPRGSLIICVSRHTVTALRSSSQCIPHWATSFHQQVIEKKTKLNNYTIQHNETKRIDRLSYI